MIPRPHYAQPGCVYFICLLRDDLLLRQGVYTDSNKPYLSELSFVGHYGTYL